MKRRSILAAGSASLASLAFHASAQAQFPAKPIRLVVPFPPGGGADIVARLIATPLGEALGQPILVDNRAGADGLVAADAVLKSPADGHTLFFGTATGMSAAPALRKTMPYDPVGDFTPISRIGTFVFFVLVPEELPARTLADFIAYARANPGKVNYGTGTGTAIIGIAQLAQLAKLQMVHVPYKGDAPLTVDLLAGRVQLGMSAGGPALPHVRAGKLRVLATLLPERSPLLPEVPTLSQAGAAGFSISPWGGLFGPPMMAPNLVDQLHRSVVRVCGVPELRDQLSRNAFEVQTSTPGELRTFVREQLAIWKAVASAAGIQPE